MEDWASKQYYLWGVIKPFEKIMTNLNKAFIISLMNNEKKICKARHILNVKRTKLKYLKVQTGWIHNFHPILLSNFLFI